MNVKITTLSFNTLSGEFDDAEFSEFILNKEILSVSEHFFIKNDTPYLTLIIKHSHSEKSIVPESRNRPKVDESWNRRAFDAIFQPIPPLNPPLTHPCGDVCSAFS
jgi:hypothetical protein